MQVDTSVFIVSQHVLVLNDNAKTFLLSSPCAFSPLGVYFLCHQCRLAALDLYLSGY